MWTSLADERADREAGSAGAVGAGGGDRDLEQDPPVADHRPPVVVPVRVLAGERPVRMAARDAEQIGAGAYAWENVMPSPANRSR